MADIDKSSGPPRKGHKHGSPASSSEQAARPERFAFTMDAKTGEIIQIESIDAAGARRELSKDEKASLATGNGRPGLEQIIEQAFEAGIACLLGGEDEPDEAKEEAELRHILLKPLIDESSAAGLMRPDVLDRAIVETLIHHSLTSRSQGPKDGRSGSGPDRPTPKATR
jgi:hypothetical protein